MIQKIKQTLGHKYEILDYIITPSSSEVNTEVLVNGTTVVEMTCALRQRSYQTPRFFSSNDTNTDVPGWHEAGTWGLQFEDRGNNLSIKMLGADYSRLSDRVVVRTGITYNDLNNKKLRYNLTAAGILTIFNTDDTVFRSYDATAETDTSATSSTPIKLFHRFTSYEYINNGTYVYDVKIWDNDVLIRHYLPVKRLSDNVYGLYDIINNTFHSNEVSGYSFSGTSKSTPEYIDGTIEQKVYVNDIILHGSPTVEHKYEILDYIETNATSNTNMSWINTGFRPSNNTRLEFKTVLPANRVTYDIYRLYTLCSAMTWTNASSHSGGDLSFGYIIRTLSYEKFLILGSRTDSSRGNMYEYNPNPFASNDGIEHTLECEISTQSFKVTLDGTTNTYTPQTGPWLGLDGTANTVSELALFAIGYTDSNGNLTPSGTTTQRSYYFKIYDNNVLVRDYIPVKRLSDNKYGLYDRVNNTFNVSPNGVDFSGTSKSTPEYIDETVSNLYHINRIYLGGNVYWGNDIAHTPSEWHGIRGTANVVSVTLNNAIYYNETYHNVNVDKYGHWEIEENNPIYETQGICRNNSITSIDFTNTIWKTLENTHTDWPFETLFKWNTSGTSGLTDVYFDFTGQDTEHIFFGPSQMWGTLNNCRCHGLGTFNWSGEINITDSTRPFKAIGIRETSTNLIGTFDIRGIDTTSITDQDQTYMDWLRTTWGYGLWFNFGRGLHCDTWIVGKLEIQSGNSMALGDAVPYVKTLYCTSQIPPSLNRTGLTGTQCYDWLSQLWSLTNIYVPMGCLSAYQNAPLWRNRVSIMSEREAPDPLNI